MEANEMMLGDWVSFNGEPVKVQQVVSGINELDYEPIPLTAEILDENGFSYRSLGGAEEWFIADDYYDIVVYEWSDSIWVFRYECTEMNTPHEQRVFGYVHNLQHALRDNGIDKEIVL